MRLYASRNWCSANDAALVVMGGPGWRKIRSIFPALSNRNNRLKSRLILRRNGDGIGEVQELMVWRRFPGCCRAWWTTSNIGEH